MTGAVALDECPRVNKSRACRCEPCTVCGWGKHTSVHGPHDGQPPGSEPWDHQYVRPPADDEPAFTLEITVRTRSGHTTHGVDVESLADLESLGSAVRLAIDAWIERSDPELTRGRCTRCGCRLRSSDAVKPTEVEGYGTLEGEPEQHETAEACVLALLNERATGVQHR